jgi:hypothetical protein
MATSSDKSARDTDEFPAPPGTDRHSETTAKDMVVPLPEYLQEVHAALQRAEQAYAGGDLALCAQCAEEGLLMLRLPLPKTPKAGVPPCYDLFFRSFRHHAVYRQALALYKQGLLRRRSGAAADQARQAWRQAWDLLEKHFTGFEARLAVGTSASDFPVAGRVLRGILRLRDKVCETLAEP